ncbi:MAG: DUF4405 domain-containing protein [Candidatus Metalachnospira sp.]|nr:DUF4405 domain-containing protein [Candidatus Metalachnospira sp.]
MKNKRMFKIILDIIMLVLLVLMFKKNAISMSFHEIGGLALICLFAIHNLINAKWLKAVFGKFFGKGINSRTRIVAIVDLLLAIDFILIGISGVFISKAVFDFSVMGGSWKTIHYFCAAVSIVLMGVHLGLHWDFIKNAFGKLRYGKAAKVVGSVFLIAAIANGVYGTVSTSFTRWLAMPFSVNAEVENVEGEETGQQAKISDESGGENSIDSVTSATTSTSESNNNRGNGRGIGGGIHQNVGGISASNIFSTISSYLSIIVLFAFITVLLSNLIIGMRRRINYGSSNDYITGKCREL